MLNIVKGPYLQWPTQDSIKVMWETSQPASSTVTYSRTQRVHSGLSGGFHTLEDSESKVEGDGGTEFHTVTLDNLDPETTYHYQVISTGEDGD